MSEHEFRITLDTDDLPFLGSLHIDGIPKIGGQGFTIPEVLRSLADNLTHWATGEAIEAMFPKPDNGQEARQ